MSREDHIKLIRKQEQRKRDLHRSRVARLHRNLTARARIRRGSTYTPPLELPSTAFELAVHRALYIDKNKVKVDWMKEGF